jgi:hypothetical protein
MGMGISMDMDLDKEVDTYMYKKWYLKRILKATALFKKFS